MIQTVRNTSIDKVGIRIKAQTNLKNREFHLYLKLSELCIHV